MLIAGADPGGTTGWCTIYVPEDDNEMPEIEDVGQIEDGYKGLIKHSGGWFCLADLLVYESFILRRGGPMTSDQIAPAYCIGVLATQADAESIPIIGRTPAENKSAVSDAQLKKLGLYGPTGHDLRHSRDAIRVVVGYLKNSGHRAVLKKGWG